MADWFRHPLFRERNSIFSRGTVDPGTSPG